MTLTIQPDPGTRGGKIITVDGELYGYVHMHQHGAHGVSYTFEQAGGETIMREEPSKSKRGARFSEVVVRGDKMEKRQALFKVNGETAAERIDAVLPVAERIHACAQDLVSQGLLVPEHAYRALKEAEHSKWLAEHAQQERNAELMLYTEACARLDGFRGMTSDVIDVVVKLMKWAQTK